MEIELTKITCASCHVPFWVSSIHYRHLTNSHESFFCPSGHSQKFVSETEEEKLRKLVRSKDDEITNMRFELDKCKKKKVRK